RDACVNAVRCLQLLAGRRCVVMCAGICARWRRGRRLDRAVARHRGLCRVADPALPGAVAATRDAAVGRLVGTALARLAPAPFAPRGHALPILPKLAHRFRLGIMRANRGGTPDMDDIKRMLIERACERLVTEYC